jgi:hypothetical protein
MRLSPPAFPRASAAVGPLQALRGAAEGEDVFSRQVAQGLELSGVRAAPRWTSEGERAGVGSPRQADPPLLPPVPPPSFAGGARRDVRAHRVAPPLPRDLPRQIRYLEARVAAGERGDGIPLP